MLSTSRRIVWFALASSLLAACGGSADLVNPVPSGSVEVQSIGKSTVTFPGGAPLPGETQCRVTVVREIPLSEAKHLPVCTEIQYPTNPPSGGDHWPVWAAYKAYTTPVPRESYVHNLEHGGVVLAYRCDGCDEVVSALQDVIDGTPKDPACAQVNARFVLTPDPALEAPIAAAAWGATYTATCIDTPSLKAFAAETYGRGTEDECANGRDFDVQPFNCAEGLQPDDDTPLMH